MALTCSDVVTPFVSVVISKVISNIPPYQRHHVAIVIRDQSGDAVRSCPAQIQSQQVCQISSVVEM